MVTFWTRLQSVLNAAARLVFSARRSERITPLLRDLHSLRVPERIRFRLCSDVPMSQRHSSVLPRWQYLPGSWRRGPQSPALVSHSNSDCPACQEINAGRPIIHCRCSTGMEQSTVSRTGCAVAHHLPTRTENISLLLEFSGPLVAKSSYMLYEPKLRYARFWLDLGRRLARLPARPTAWPACTRALHKPRPVAIATILLLYIDVDTLSTM